MYYSAIVLHEQQQQFYTYNTMHQTNQLSDYNLIAVAPNKNRIRIFEIQQYHNGKCLNKQKQRQFHTRDQRKELIKRTNLLIGGKRLFETKKSGSKNKIQKGKSYFFKAHQISSQRRSFFHNYSQRHTPCLQKDDYIRSLSVNKFYPERSSRIDKQKSQLDSSRQKFPNEKNQYEKKSQNYNNQKQQTDTKINNSKDISSRSRDRQQQTKFVMTKLSLIRKANTVHRRRNIHEYIQNSQKSNTKQIKKPSSIQINKRPNTVMARRGSNQWGNEGTIQPW